MNTKNIAAIFSALMITLVISGVAYAHWTDSLVIEADVYTGNIDVGLSACIWLDGENTKDIYGPVATAYIEVLDPLTPGPVKHVKITVENAYPSLDAIVVFDAVNFGSVPVALVSYDRFPDDTVQYNADWDRAIEQIDQGWYTDSQVYGTPCQLDPYDWSSDAKWWWWWHLHVTNDAEQGETVYFYATIEFWNWNEAPGDAICDDLPYYDIRPIYFHEDMDFLQYGPCQDAYYPDMSWR